LNITACAVAEGCLQPRDTLTDYRAHGCAPGKDEADHHHLALNQVAVEAQPLSVLIETINVRNAGRGCRFGGGLRGVGLVLVYLLRLWSRHPEK
jgi:hypothetical protein